MDKIPYCRGYRGHYPNRSNQRHQIPLHRGGDMKRIALTIVLLLLAAPCMAQNSVTLQWDLSLSEPLGTGGGYKCYTSKQSMTYTTTPAGQVAPGDNSITLSSLPYGRNFFVCTAF